MSFRKYILAGALAGFCMVIMAMLCVILILYTGVFWQYLFNSQIPIIQDMAAGAVIQDISRLPSFIWGWRWIIVGSTLSGAFLALLQRGSQRLAPAWRERTLLLVVFTAVTGFVIARLLMSQAQALYKVSNAAERLATLASNQPSVWQALLLSIVAGLGIAAILWMGWSWWYVRYCRWLGPKTKRYVDTPQLSSEQWFDQRKQDTKARRILLLLLPISFLALFGSASLYDRARPTIMSGELWLDSQAPRATAALPIQASTHSLFIENTYGSGQASVELLDINNTSQSKAVLLTFRDNKLSYERTEIDAATLKPGNYHLAAELEQGTNARVGYALIQGEDPPMLLSAILLGLCTGLMLALGVAIASERVQYLSGVGG